MSNSEINKAGLQIGLRALGITLPVILTLIGLVWTGLETRINQLEARLGRQEQRTQQLIERVESRLERIENRLLEAR